MLSCEAPPDWANSCCLNMDRGRPSQSPTYSSSSSPVREAHSRIPLIYGAGDAGQQGWGDLSDDAAPPGDGLFCNEDNIVGPQLHAGG